MKKLFTIALICYGLSIQAQELKKLKVDSIEITINHTWEDHNLEKHTKQHLKREDNFKQAVYHLVTVLPFVFLAGFYNGKG